MICSRVCHMPAQKPTGCNAVLDSCSDEVNGINNSSNWQGALEDPTILSLYCNSLAIYSTNELQFMILLPPNTLRNDLGNHSSSMQFHLSRCHNLHLGLKTQCEPAENTVLICWIIRQMLLFGTSSKDTCWQLALKGQWHLLDALQTGQQQNLILAEVKESFVTDLKHARISLTIANDLYVYLRGYG